MKWFVFAASIVFAGGISAVDVDWTDRAVRQKAVLETAYAYYLKGGCVQYGSMPLVTHTGMEFCRRTKEGRPEDATPDSTYYTVCSSFTYETYFNAIGYRHSGSADTSLTILLTTRPQEATVFEYDRRLDPDGAKYESEMMRMRTRLQPGDIIVYSKIKGTSPKTGELLGGGHALIYVGDEAGDGHPLVMHSGGAKYDFATGTDQVEKGGTIRLDEMDTYFFHGVGISGNTKIMVFRPLDLPAERYPLTESAKARYLHPRLRIDRMVDVGQYGSVVTGGELRYSIELGNFSKVPYTVQVRERVPEGTELLPDRSFGGMTRSGDVFGWDVRLSPGERRTVLWSVRVSAAAGSRIIASGGTVAGIPSNTLMTEVVPRHVSAAVARAWAEATIVNATNLPACRVEGWAGGRRSLEPPREVRVRDPRASQLMEGDVVVVCPNLGRPEIFRLWVKGRGGLEEATQSGIRRVSDAEVVALLAKPFFAALRPARLADVERFEARQRSVVSTAFSYFTRGAAVQHSPTGTMAGTVSPDGVEYVTPLSFVDGVCRKALGVSLCDDVQTTTVSNIVVAPPDGMLVFEYDVAGDKQLRRYDEKTSWLWSIIEPGDIVAMMTDHPDKKGRPGLETAFVYVGDVRGDGHPLYLHVAGTDEDAGSGLARASGAISRRIFDSLLHGRSVHCLKNRSKVVVLRPAAKKLNEKGNCKND